MLEYIQNFGFEILVIFVLGVGGYVLKQYGKKWLIGRINDLIQIAEVNIQGSKLGEEKKAWVIAQLKIAGIKVTASVEKLIDKLVDVMNTEKTSLIDVISKK